MEERQPEWAEKLSKSATTDRREAARILGVSMWTVTRLVKEGYLDEAEPGSRRPKRRLTTASVLRLAQHGTRQPAPAPAQSKA